MTDGFGPDAARRVLRRAAELTEEHDPGAAPDRYSQRALVEAAEEVGLDADSVLVAAAEERLGLLDVPHGALERAVGPSTVEVHTIAPGTPHEVLTRMDRWLRRRGGMRSLRLDPGAGTAHYERRSDVVAGLQRSVRSMSGREHLGTLRRIDVTVTAVDGGRSMVVARCDLSALRRGSVAGGTAVAGGGIAASVAVATMVDVAAVIPLLGVPVSIVAGWGVLSSYKHTVSRSGLALDGVLRRAAGASLRP